MSKVAVQNPVVHTPSIQRWGVPVGYVDQIVKDLGFQLLYPNGVHATYWYTNEEGVLKLLPHIIQKSSLYKKDNFTCVNYAFKVWNLLGETYSINTCPVIIGTIPGCLVRHAWNLILMGDGGGIVQAKSLFFEPNDGWDMGIELENAGQAFPIGEAGYAGEFIFY